MSHLFAKRDQAAFNLQLLTALRHIVFWSIPIIGLVVILRAHIVRVLLGSGEFDWSDTRLTAAVLALFVVSLAAQAVLLLVIRAFYAGGRTVIPLLYSLISSVLAIGCAYGGLWLWRNSQELQLFVSSQFRLEAVPGSEVLVLAAAFTLGQLVQVVMLLIQARKTFSFRVYPLARLLGQSVIAAVVGAITAYGTLQFVVEGINQEAFIGIALQGLAAGIAGTVAIVMTYWVLRSPELHETLKSFRKKILQTDFVAPQ